MDARNNTASGVLATSNGTALRLFLYNHPLFSSTEGSDCAITVTLDGATVDETVGASMTRIDATHSNPKAAYLKQGSPEYPSKAQLAELETASELVWEPLPMLAAGSGGQAGASSFTVTVPANGLAVVDLALPNGNYSSYT